MDDVLRAKAQLEGERDVLAERLREAGAALLDANQVLAQIPLLEHQVAERDEQNAWLAGERERLEAEVERLRARVGELEKRALG